jgi:N6-L-threonylcarbamoyladenine synthase
MIDQLPRADLTILALETSCDETAAAVVRGGTTILSSIVSSQMATHQQYGGVVPEIASRQHITGLVPVVQAALAAVPGGWSAIDAVAATHGPGLSGALLTGLNAAKGIAFQRGLPFVGVNHLEAHLYAAWLESDPPQFPLVALIVSGGHTILAVLRGHGDVQILGQTRDDAAGEAFDKVARILGLGYPGGPAIQKAAERGGSGPALPRAWLRDTYDFSFSGVKTAVLHRVQERQAQQQRLTEGFRPAVSPPPLDAAFVAQQAYAFEESVVDVLVTKTIQAARQHAARAVLLAGGVAANRRLRAELMRRSPLPLHLPALEYCTDNAAMVAAAAYFRYERGRRSGWAIDVTPGLPLGAA